MEFFLSRVGVQQRCEVCVVDWVIQEDVVIYLEANFDGDGEE